MRSVTYDRYGKPDEVLIVADRQSASPKEYEVLIRVKRVPIHPGDLLGVEGRYRKAGDARDPAPGAARPGFEGTGVVVSTGAGAADDTLKPGARVAFFPVAGAWSDEVVVPVANVTPLPNDISDEVGAQLLINSLTASMLVRALMDTGAGPGDAVAFSAAGSAVAKLSMQLTIDKGLTPLAVIRSASGIDAVSADFPDIAVVSTDSDDWGELLVEAAGSRALRAVLDPVGGKIAGELLARLANGGHFISYGDFSGDPIPVPPLALPTRGLKMSGVNVGGWSQLSADVRKADVATAIRLAQHSPNLFPVSATFDVKDVRVAARKVREAGRRGTVLLSFSSEKE
jgi:NADPH:quinone reductase-like Zn-dependent oxidoreductase